MHLIVRNPYTINSIMQQEDRRFTGCKIVESSLIVK